MSAVQVHETMDVRDMGSVVDDEGGVHRRGWCGRDRLGAFAIHVGSALRRDLGCRDLSWDIGWRVRDREERVEGFA